MENRNLKIIIIVLVLLVLGLSGFIIYNKILTDEEVQEQENEQDINNNLIDNKQENDYIEHDETLKEELTDVFKFVYNYYDWGNAYCGEIGEGYLSTSEVAEDFLYSGAATGYRESSKYNTYDEMIKELKKYMTEHVIYGNHYMGKDNGSYIEKDGKLYCADFAKGGNIYQPENIKIIIDNTNNDEIKTTINVELSSAYPDASNIFSNYDVIFSKQEDNWIISSYEQTN